jgi:polyferredoxin
VTAPTAPSEPQHPDGYLAPSRVALGKQVLTPNVPRHNQLSMYWVLGSSPFAALLAAAASRVVFVGLLAGGLWILTGWGLVTDSVADITVADFLKNSLRWLREPKRYYLKLEKGSVTHAQDQAASRRHDG